MVEVEEVVVVADMEGKVVDIVVGKVEEDKGDNNWS